VMEDIRKHDLCLRFQTQDTRVVIRFMAEYSHERST
jgi:hypothetical protein